MALISFLPYLLGESDNAPKTLEWASQITGVSAEKIKELADLFVSNRTFLAGNWAMQRAQYGEQPDWALIVLASMIGQVGLSGGGFGFSMHYGGNAQDSLLYALGAMKQSRNSLNLRVTWNGLRAFMKKAMALL